VSLDEKAPPSYPKFFRCIVGLGDAKLKTFTENDMQALVETFRLATGVDPLTATEPLLKIMADSLEGR